MPDLSAGLTQTSARAFLFVGRANILYLRAFFPAVALLNVRESRHGAAQNLHNALIIS